MFSATNLGLLAIIVACLLNILIPWIRNIQIAKASGLPYVIVPYYSYNRVTALLMSRTLLRLCARCLGDPSPTSWRTLVTGTWAWKHRHTPFAMLGTDTFLSIAPGGIVLSTADADVVAQVVSRQTDFPKASHLYKSLSIFGDNVVTSEGATWRYHRKLTSPVFTESNNQLVWKQSLHDAQAMLSGWLNTTKDAITTLEQDTMLLSLSVIGRAMLGQTIHWPSAKQDLNAEGDQVGPAGHQMTFTVALTTLLRKIYYIVILPQWFLRTAPIKVVKRSYLAYLEWSQYLHEIISSRREQMADSKSASPVINDFLTQLLKEHETSTISTKSDRACLTDSEILGNVFVMIVAGHETTAGSIHFCFALLAMHPRIQRDVQNELDLIFQGRSPDQWDYDKDLPKLFNSKLNAVLNEELRLFGALTAIPKYTTTPQPLKVNGQTVTVPPKTIVRLSVPSLHRNPACWPSSSSGEEKTNNDLETFRPSRWYNADQSWYQPPKCAYIPFSEGARGCLGRRFAQVEILAALALVLTSHTVELAVDGHGSALESDNVVGDDNLQKVVSDDKERQEAMREAWSKARDQARATMKENMSVIISLQLRGGAHVPVRIAKRGEERFAGLW